MARILSSPSSNPRSPQCFPPPFLLTWCHHPPPISSISPSLRTSWAAKKIPLSQTLTDLLLRLSGLGGLWCQGTDVDDHFIIWKHGALTIGRRRSKAQSILPLVWYITTERGDRVEVDGASYMGRMRVALLYEPERRRYRLRIEITSVT